MEEINPLKDAIDALFFKALNLYGDAIEKFWIYEDKICPCCKIRKIDPFEREGGPAMSLNSFMFRDMNVLIAYFLCGKCINLLLKKGKKGVKEYNSIEETLKVAYCDSLKSEAS
jgi:hypothetical protein